MESLNKIRFGIIGCGNIARRFSQALNQSAHAELFACAARDEERAKVFAKEYGAQKSYGSYQAILEDQDVDAVYIATVHSTHAQIAKDCIRAGKPLLCEKPFFINSSEAQEVIELGRERGVLMMEGFWTRTQPAYLKVKEWISEGRIGEARLIRAAFCFPVPYSEATKSSRLWNPQLGGGALLDAGVYPYMYVTGLMGGPPQDFTAMVQRVDSGVDMSVIMCMRYPGLLADCLTSIAGRMDDSAIISGTQGYIKQHRFLGSRKAELYNQRGELVDSFSDPVEEGFIHEIDHFVQLIRSKDLESPLIPLADTLDFARKVDYISCQ